MRLPPHICPKRWDTVFYSPDEKIVYRLPEYAHLFTPRRITLMDEAMRRSNLLLADLYSSGRAPHLIHGDLNYGNVHVHRDRLYLLDFEDIMLGYPCQDIAVTLYYGRDRDDYPELKAAYQ